MRSVIVAGVAAVALTLGGCGMFGSKSDNQTSANDQSSTPGTMESANGSASPTAGSASTSTAPSSTSNSSAGSAATTAPSSSAQSGTSAGSADVREAQQELQSAGLYNGKIDGIDGPQTKAAIKSFQQKKSLRIRT